MPLLLAPLPTAPLPGLAALWPPAIPLGGWSGAPVITINGVAVTLVSGVPPIQDVIGQRGQVRLTVQNAPTVLVPAPPGSGIAQQIQPPFSFREGHPVSITDGASGVVIWSGWVVSATQQRVAYAPPTYGWVVTCVDNVALADRRIVAGAWENVTCGAIVRQIVNDYLGAEGVWVRNIQDGPTLTSYIIPYEPASKHLTALAQLAGFYWNIDAYRGATFAAYNTTPAPFTFDGTQSDDPDGNSLMSVQRTAPLYRNGQYLLGITEVTSPQTETRQGDGSTSTFTVNYPLHAAPSALTVNGVAKTFGINGVDSGKDWYWKTGSNVLSQDSSGVKLINTDTWQITYVGEYQTLVYTEDDEAIAGWQAAEGNTTSGRVEMVTTDTTLVGAAAGFQAAGALLAKYATAGKILTFKTRVGGLQSGMLLPVAMPVNTAWDLPDDDFLIQSVTATFDNFHWWYDVTALEGPVNDTWVQFFQRLASQRGTIDTSGSGTAQSVTLLATGAAAWTWTVTGSATVYSLLTPSATLYPSSTLYPGTAGAPVAITWTKTQAGLNALRDVLSGAGSTLKVGWLAWGTGSQGSPATATTLASEVGRKAVASVTNGASPGEDLINGYLGPNDANVAITEVAFFAGPSASITPGSGVMLLYGAYTHTKTGQESITIQADSTIS